MTRESHRNDLGDFLKARRGELSPADAGLPTGGQARRVAGLRREEVAMLAAISTDYYTRLEQGRIQASPSVLNSLSRVLRLDRDQRAYLHELASRHGHQPYHHRPAGYQAEPQLQRMLDDMAHTPAFVIGPRTEVVAWNAMGAALITDFAKLPDERYYIRMLFTDPAMRDLYADWEGVTRLAIAQMRRHNADNPGDPRLTALVAELSTHHAEFRKWWADHEVATRGTGTKHLHHPVVGDLILDWSAVTWAAEPDLQIIVWTAEANSPSSHGLQQLAVWTAGNAARTTSANAG
jgi:MmyB-like transcription regulator ligand binding domain/Helix-turn-helix domain